MKKGLIVVIAVVSLFNIIGCGRNKADSNEKAVSEKSDIVNEEQKYKKEDVINLIKENKKIHMIETKSSDSIEVEFNNGLYEYHAVDGELQDYKKLEKYILETWSTMEDFNGENRMPHFKNVNGKSYKLAVDYRDIYDEAKIALISETKKNGILDAKIAYRSIEDTIGESSASKYSLTNITFKDNNGLKLIKYEVEERRRDIFSDIKDIQETNMNMTKKEFDEYKNMLVEIIRMFEVPEFLDHHIVELERMSKDFDKIKKAKIEFKNLEGTYVDDGSNLEWKENITIEVKDGDTLIINFGIEDMKNPLSSLAARNMKFGELKRVDKNLWSAKLKNDAFIREWEAEVKFENGVLLYKETSFNSAEYNKENYTEIDPNEKSVYQNPVIKKFYKK